MWLCGFKLWQWGALKLRNLWFAAHVNARRWPVDTAGGVTFAKNCTPASSTQGLKFGEVMI